MAEKPDDEGQAPPPSYNEVVQPLQPGPRPGDCLLELGQERPRPAQELGAERVEVRCGACHRQVRRTD